MKVNHFSCLQYGGSGEFTMFLIFSFITFRQLQEASILSTIRENHRINDMDEIPDSILLQYLYLYNKTG